MSLTDQLFSACEDGDCFAVRKILRKAKFLIFSPVGPNCKNAEGNTPLFVATQFGHLDLIEQLLNNGAEINHRNQANMTALILAAGVGRDDIVAFLLSQGRHKSSSADPNLTTKGGSTALYVAAEYGHDDVVNTLLSYDAEIDAAIEDKSTALYIAAQNGFATVVEILLEEGANIDVELVDQSTPIFSAAHRGHSKVVETLVRYGAATDIVLANGSTLLEVASNDEIRDIVRRETDADGASEPLDDPQYAGDSGTFVDTRDGNEYRWVRIGGKVWMAENMRYEADEKCWPSEDVDTLGYLYGRPAIPQACPEGWRAPEKSDFEELIEIFGGESKAYGPLMINGASGFNAVQAGRRYDDGRITNTDTAYFWALKLDYEQLAWFLKLTGYDEEAVVSETWDEGLKTDMGASLRCIKL